MRQTYSVHTHIHSLFNIPLLLNGRSSTKFWGFFFIYDGGKRQEQERELNIMERFGGVVF